MMEKLKVKLKMENQRGKPPSVLKFQQKKKEEEEETLSSSIERSVTLANYDKAA